MQRIISALPLPKAFSVAELGAQTWEYKSAEEWYRNLGAVTYHAFDMSGQHGATELDLNLPPPASAVTDRPEDSGFDLVTNNGTGEHCFSPASVFHWAHHLCKPSGLMVHVLPWAGWVNHGFYNFQPVLFRDLSQANGYATIGLYASERNGRLERIDGNPSIDPWHHPKPRRERITPIEQVLASFGERANISIVAILRKGEAHSKFTFPSQGKYAEDYATFKAPTPEEKVASVLGRKTQVVCPDPFPHIVIPNALPQALYDHLAKTFPPLAKIAPEETDPALGNTLHQLSAHKVIGNPEFDPVWRKFFMYHTGHTWFQDIMATFSEQLIPLMAKVPQHNGAHSVGIRGTGEFGLSLDCQFGVNTPPKHLCRVRGPHVDSADELLAGLLYFAEPGDVQGGAFELHRIKRAFPLYGKAEVPEGATEAALTVPYAPNTLVMFVNSASAVHSVTPRAAGPLPRRYINFTITADRPVIELPKHDHTLSQEPLRAPHRREQRSN